MPISKLEAAQRQLDCAIRLYFAEDDLLAVHTLSRAAFRILFDLYPKKSADEFSKDLEGLIKELGWGEFNRISNFLKHADNDPDQVIDKEYETETQMGIGFAIILHHRLTKSFTPEMRAFDEWIKITHPEEFKLRPDSDPAFEAAYRESVEFLKSFPPKDRFLLPNALLTFFRGQPDGGNTWYRPGDDLTMERAPHRSEEPGRP